MKQPLQHRMSPEAHASIFSSRRPRLTTHEEFICPKCNRPLNSRKQLNQHISAQTCKRQTSFRDQLQPGEKIVAFSEPKGRWLPAKFCGISLSQNSVDIRFIGLSPYHQQATVPDNYINPYPADPSLSVFVQMPRQCERERIIDILNQRNLNTKRVMIQRNSHGQRCIIEFSTHKEQQLALLLAQRTREHYVKRKAVTRSERCV